MRKGASSLLVSAQETRAVGRWLSRENVGSASMIGTVQGGGMNRTMTVLAIVGILAALYFLNKYGLY